VNKTATLLALLLLAAAAPALDLGAIAGSQSDANGFVFGLSLGSGTVVPLLKLEFEGMRLPDAGGNALSAALKLRPKFGAFAPYAVLGAGAEFARLNLHFGDYGFYTFIGGGFHYFLAAMFSLRADIRFLNLPAGGKTRLSGGLFLHL